MKKLKDLQYIFKGDRVIWIVFFLLCTVSIIEVYSSSSRLGFKDGNYWFAATYHSITLGIGFLCMLVTLNIPCKYFKALTPLVFLLAVGLLILVYFVGTTENDASRWLKIGFIPLQPSEIAKGALVLATAKTLSELQTPEGVEQSALKYIIAFSLVLIGLVFPENFSTAAIMGLVVFIMMFVGRVSIKQLAKVVAVVVGICIFSLLLIMTLGTVKTEDNAGETAIDNKVMVDGAQNNSTKPTEEEEKPKDLLHKVLHRMDVWKTRIVTFTDVNDPSPEEFDMTKREQEGRAQIAIASSGVIGKGPGHSVQRDQLPLAFSDFIYAIIIEEFGLFGLVALPLLYMILLFRTAIIAQNCENTFPALLALGMALIIVIQALFNMGVAVGLLPITGQPLPLVSKGGTSGIITCIYFGVILSVSRTAKKRVVTTDEAENNIEHTIQSNNSQP